MYGLIYLLSILSIIPTFYGLIGSWRSRIGEPRRVWYDSIWALGSLAIAITSTHNWFIFITSSIVFIILGFSVVSQLALYYEFKDSQAAYEGWKTIMKEQWKEFKTRTRLSS